MADLVCRAGSWHVVGLSGFHLWPDLALGPCADQRIRYLGPGHRHYPWLEDLSPGRIIWAHFTIPRDLECCGCAGFNGYYAQHRAGQFTQVPW